MKNCIVLHLYYQDYWPMFWEYLKDIVNESANLYVTVNNIETEFYEDIKSKATEVFVLENKGMDFGPFLYVLDKIKNKDYLTVTKLHGKKGHGAPFHQKNGYRLNSSEWMLSLLLPLIKNVQTYQKLIKLFEENSNLYLVGSSESYRLESPDHPYAKENSETFKQLNALLDLPESELLTFIAGSIFTVSKKYLDLLLKRKELEIYNEMNFIYANNGTLSHGLERYIGSYINYYGGQTLLL
jgi:lipopolysaccharide biosynthesis protein